jgi:hypothetical protein
MCIEQKIAKQQSDNKRKTKYEMGNFYEQYGILPIAPSQRNHNKHRIDKHQKRSFWKKHKNFEPSEYYNKKKKKLLKNPINIIKNIITRNLIKRK